MVALQTFKSNNSWNYSNISNFKWPVTGFDLIQICGWSHRKVWSRRVLSHNSPFLLSLTRLGTVIENVAKTHFRQRVCPSKLRGIAGWRQQLQKSTWLNEYAFLQRPISFCRCCSFVTSHECDWRTNIGVTQCQPNCIVSIMQSSWIPYWTDTVPKLQLQLVMIHLSFKLLIIITNL